jgi:hypothetical protein
VKPPGGRKPSLTATLAAAGVLVIAAASIMYFFWPRAESDSKKLEPAGAGLTAANPLGAIVPPSQPAVPMALRRHILQGGADVYDALIDFAEPTRRFGDETHGNALRRAEAQCSALLVRFDLSKLKLKPNARVESAMLSFYVWDPSSHGKTRVNVYPMKTAWDESSVTWQAPQVGKSWQRGPVFSLDADAGPAGPAVTVLPEAGADTADPPIEYQFDVTELARAWLDGSAPNLGVAIAPAIDPSVDEGILSRFQVFSSEYSHVNQTPKLTLQVRE